MNDSSEESEPSGPGVPLPCPGRTWAQSADWSHLRNKVLSHVVIDPTIVFAPHGEARREVDVDDHAEPYLVLVSLPGLPPSQCDIKSLAISCRGSVNRREIYAAAGDLSITAVQD